jgi:hypothetical protein
MFTIFKVKDPMKRAITVVLLLLLLLCLFATISLPVSSRWVGNRFGVETDKLLFLLTGLAPLIIFGVTLYLFTYAGLESRTFLQLAILSLIDFGVYLFVIFFVFGAA